MADTPFRIEVVTITGLTVASTFPLQHAVATAAAYVGDADGFPAGSIHDRIGLRTVLLRLYGELLSEAKRVELLDDEGVAWLIPGERVLADPGDRPGADARRAARGRGREAHRLPAPPDGRGLAPRGAERSDAGVRTVTGSSSRPGEHPPEERAGLASEALDALEGVPSHASTYAANDGRTNSR